MRILVAEDDESIREMYVDALTARGHEVVVTSDGKKCINEFQKSVIMTRDKLDEPFDAVVLDYSMPVKDGLQTAIEILDLKQNQRIIFASAYTEATLVEAVKKLKMIVELLQKPFKVQVLVDTLESTTLFKELSQLNVNIKRLKFWNPSHQQLSELLEGLLKVEKKHVKFAKILHAS